MPMPGTSARRFAISDNEDLQSGKHIPICRGVMGSHSFDRQCAERLEGGFELLPFRRGARPIGMQAGAYFAEAVP
jgi:hypothetical protein